MGKASGEMEKKRDYFFYPAHLLFLGGVGKGVPWGMRMALSWEEIRVRGGQQGNGYQKGQRTALSSSFWLVGER